MSRRNPRWPSPVSVHTIVFDFDGVFTDNKVLVSQDGVESVICDRADGLAMDMLRRCVALGRLKAEMFILSREANPVVKARAAKLKLDCKNEAGNKKAFMDAYLAKRFPADAAPYRGVVFLGNDLNDLALLQAAGFSVAPKDAHPAVKRCVTTTLDRRGGDGFVRAFVEKFLKLDDMESEEIHELIHNR